MPIRPSDHQTLVVLTLAHTTPSESSRQEGPNVHTLCEPPSYSCSGRIFCTAPTCHTYLADRFKIRIRGALLVHTSIKSVGLPKNRHFVISCSLSPLTLTSYVISPVPSLRAGVRRAGVGGERGRDAVRLHPLHQLEGQLPLPLQTDNVHSPRTRRLLFVLLSLSSRPGGPLKLNLWLRPSAPPRPITAEQVQSEHNERAVCIRKQTRSRCAFSRCAVIDRPPTARNDRGAAAETAWKLQE